MLLLLHVELQRSDQCHSSKVLPRKHPTCCAQRGASMLLTRKSSAVLPGLLGGLAKRLKSNRRDGDNGDVDEELEDDFDYSDLQRGVVA
eukprot:1157656-Pelagomonas_calceolata.AAC.4